MKIRPVAGRDRKRNRASPRGGRRVKVHICQLYPDLLNLYGDRGNILTLASRCRRRDMEPVIRQVSPGEMLNLEEIDILFLGGGSEREQKLLLQEMRRWEEKLREAAEDGLVVLAICGSYQMLGKYYQTADGEKIQGLDIIDSWTIAGDKRLTGNIIVKSGEKTVVGFENHSGKTYLGENTAPLGKVLFGQGNNGEDGKEGARYKNVFGTYLHGPLLPKNPHLADLLLELALKRRGCDAALKPLDDHIETLAHDAMVKRLLK